MTYDILPLRAAFLWIFLSTVFVVGIFGGGYWLYHWYEVQAATDDKYRIVSIVQQLEGGQPLSTDQLAGLIGLSWNRPTYLPAFKAKIASKCLLNCPYIKRADIRTMPPDTIGIDYETRLPMAVLAGYANVLVDEEGVALPLAGQDRADFPEFVLGDLCQEVVWGKKVACTHFDECLSLYQTLSRQCVQRGIVLKKVDMSRRDALSAGQRELIVVLEMPAYSQSSATHFLRLGVDQWEKDLRNYWTLYNQPEALKKTFLIDLRVPQLAFLSPLHYTPAEN